MKACLIGLGRMGIRHLEALKNLGIEISGLADLRAELFDNAKNILESPDSIEFSTDPNALIKKLRPEVVVIATTATSHYQYVMEAANNGAKFILCEKPMATSIGQCEEMIKVCNEKKIKLAINHPVRFTEADIEIKNLVNSAKFGGIESITINVGNYGIAMNAGHDLKCLNS